MKPKLDSLYGSTVTSSAGVTVPLAPTLETPGTCSIAGTMLLVTIADSWARFSEGDVAERVTIVAWAGSNVRTDGAGRSAGNAARAVWMRSWTSVRSVVWFESRVKVAEIDAWFCWIVVLMWSRSGAPAIASSSGRTTASRSSDGDAPGYDALTFTVGKSMFGNCCCTSVASEKRPTSTTSATATNTSVGRLTKSCVRRIDQSCASDCPSVTPS